MKRSGHRVATGTAAAVLAVVGLLVGTASASTSTAPSCALSWGSLLKQASQGPQFPPTSLTNVRAGQHTCFDRLVIDLSGPAVGYHVGYVSEVPRQGEGLPVPLRGGAFLDVTLNAPTYAPNESNVVAVGGFRTFRQVASGGSYEGITTFGLGVRARLPFRVLALRGPGSKSRLVVDVGHRW
jgi:hypothetical protein